MLSAAAAEGQLVVYSLLRDTGNSAHGLTQKSPSYPRTKTNFFVMACVARGQPLSLRNSFKCVNMSNPLLTFSDHIYILFPLFPFVNNIYRLGPGCGFPDDLEGLSVPQGHLDQLGGDDLLRDRGHRGEGHQAQARRELTQRGKVTWIVKYLKTISTKGGSFIFRFVTPFFSLPRISHRSL